LSKISVLITSYNHERYIRACVDSALNQTYDDLEVIVIDDSSTDRSPEILRSYGDKIRLFVNNPNIGTYPSLNRALEAATGKYVAVLNSDDLWKPEKLERQIELLESEQDMAFCHTYGWFIDENDLEISGAPMGFAFPRTETGQILHTFVANNSAIASSVVMRTEFANRVGGFDGSFRNLGDWDMWLRLAETGKVGFVDEKLTLYRVHGANTIYATETTRQEEQIIRERHRARMEELIVGASDPNAMKLALAHSLACLGSLYSIAGEAAKARKCFAESLSLNPRRLKSAFRYLLTFAPLSIRRRLL
jgi:glycosyltransferase involved in cell wall biosynthesis